jgi:hypothetical protein
MPDSQPLQPDDNATVPDAPTRDAPTRKAYQKPVLAKLGVMRDVTLSVSRDGNRDGGRTGSRRNTGRGGLNGVAAAHPLNR